MSSVLRVEASVGANGIGMCEVSVLCGTCGVLENEYLFIVRFELFAVECMLSFCKGEKH